LAKRFKLAALFSLLISLSSDQLDSNPLALDLKDLGHDDDLETKGNLFQQLFLN
jgi:hypothetical protein